MNTILSALIVIGLIVAFAFWVSIVVNALQDSKINTYKKEEKNKKHDRYIDEYHDRKDKELLRKIESHKWSNNPFDHI